MQKVFCFLLLLLASCVTQVDSLSFQLLPKGCTCTDSPFFQLLAISRQPTDDLLCFCSPTKKSNCHFLIWNSQLQRKYFIPYKCFPCDAILIHTGHPTAPLPADRLWMHTQTAAIHGALPPPSLPQPHAPGPAPCPGEDPVFLYWNQPETNPVRQLHFFLQISSSHLPTRRHRDGTVIAEKRGEDAAEDRAALTYIT